MTIQEKLKYLEENKDSLEGKYPIVKKLFNDLENYQEKKVFEIWMEKIAESIAVRIDYIKEYCEEEEKKEKGKRGKCDFMIALYTVYKKITEKPYLCHINTDSCYIKNNTFSKRTLHEYEYYTHTSLHSFFWGYRSFPSDKNLNEKNNRYKTCLKQMFEHLDSSRNIFNWQNAKRIGFYDFQETPVEDIIKSDFDSAYLFNLIYDFAKERQDNPESYISDKLNKPIVKENFYTGFAELDNEFYILFDIHNKTTQTQTEINSTITKENIKDNKPDKYDYSKMKELLDDYILGGTATIYKSVIEKKELPKDAPPLRMKKPNKSNIVRFANCFGITIAEINKIFEEQVDSNNKPEEYVNTFYIILKEINPDFTQPPKKNKIFPT